MMRTQAHTPSVHRLFPHRFEAWRARGLGSRAASAVAAAGCDTVEQVAQLGRAYFEGQKNLGAKSLKQLADLAGWPPKRVTAVDTIAATLALALGDEEAREAAIDVLSSLRRAGFALTVTTHRSEGTA